MTNLIVYIHGKVGTEEYKIISAFDGRFTLTAIKIKGKNKFSGKNYKGNGKQISSSGA